MVTTSRQIKNRQDRFGAFEKNDYNKTVSFGERDDAAALNRKDYNLGGIRTVMNETAEQTQKSVVSTPIAPATDTPVKIGKKHLNVPDKFVSDAKSTNVRAGIAPRESVKLKNAIMIAVYCLAVVALVTLVVLNASALASLSAENAVLGNQVASLNGEVVSLSAELDALSDPARISNLAASALNLTEAASTNVVALEVAPLVEKTELVFENNWFDKILDGISAVIGG